MVPLSNPIKAIDGTMMHDIFVPKGTVVMFGIISCNTSSSLWGSDALEWKPERWLVPLPKAVVDARLPGVYPNQ